MKTERELFEDYFIGTDAYINIMNQAKYNHEIPIIMPFDRAITSNDMYQHLATNASWNAWQASASREGYKLVPLEPTEEMQKRGNRLALADKGYRYDCASIYEAMIGAVE